MLRYGVAALCLASLSLASVAVASAGYFTDISAMAPLSYYNAIPDGVNNSGVVTMQGYSSAYHANNQYYHAYLYTGGTAATLSDITSNFTEHYNWQRHQRQRADGGGGYRRQLWIPLQRRHERDRHLL